MTDDGGRWRIMYDNGLMVGWGVMNDDEMLWMLMTDDGGLKKLDIDGWMATDDVCW